jgi:hypothetical protein
VIERGILLAKSRQDLSGKQLQHLRMAFESGIDEFDFKVRDAGIGIGLDAVANLVWRPDEAYMSFRGILSRSSFPLLSVMRISAGLNPLSLKIG